MHKIASRLPRALFNLASGALPPPEPEAIPFEELGADEMAEPAVPPGLPVANGTPKNVVVGKAALEGIETPKIFTTSLQVVGSCSQANHRNKNGAKNI